MLFKTNINKIIISILFLLLITALYAQEPKSDLYQLSIATKIDEKADGVEVIKTEDGTVIYTDYNIKRDLKVLDAAPSAKELYEEEQKAFDQSRVYEKIELAEKLKPVDYLEYGYKTEEDMKSDLSEWLLLKDNVKIDGVYHETVDGEEGLRITYMPDINKDILQFPDSTDLDLTFDFIPIETGIVYIPVYDAVTFYTLPNLAGTSQTYWAPAVEHSYIESWANTSVRRNGGSLTAVGIYSDISSISVRAMDSDIAVYLFEEENFQGKGCAYYVLKGTSKNIMSLGSFDNKAKSFIIQREFGRKQEYLPGIAAFNELNNPVIPGSSIRSEFHDTVRSKILASSKVDGISNQHSYVRWLTDDVYCQRFGYSYNWTAKYRDLLHLRTTLTLDIDNWWFDYDIRINIYVRPVLVGNELFFWWARTDLWVEGGVLSKKICDAVWSKLSNIDIQALLHDGVRDGAGTIVCDKLVDLGILSPDYSEADIEAWGNVIIRNKERLQLSFFPVEFLFINFPRWLVAGFDTDTSAPKIHLNNNRLAD